jgi:3-hydroxyisobutyrate dehydrogenase-like beta-hydroxyacid dehydrogenase
MGLGTMGGAMARQLLASGFEVYGYDLRAEAVDAFVAEGGKAATLESLGRIGIVITSLPNDADALAALVDSGFIDGLAAGSVVIEMSTILPATIAKLEASMADKLASIVDAPVSGGPREVAEGALVILVGATDATFEIARPVLTALGTPLRVGTPGQAKVVKLVNNMMTMCNMVAAAEAFVLGVKAGIDPDRLFSVLSQSGGRSHHFLKRMPNVLDGRFEPLFSLALGEKDLRTALAFAHEANYPMPITSAAHQLYETARANDLGDEDIAAVIKLYEGWGRRQARHR